MARRVGVSQKIPTPEVQGDDSFVIISRPKVDEIAQFVDSMPVGLDESSPEYVKKSLELSKNLIARHVLEWNWVDDDGTPLAQPKDTPNIIGELTDTEMKLLTKLLTAKSSNDVKKS